MALRKRLLQAQRKVHGLVFAGLVGDGGHPGEGGDGVGSVVGCAGVAPLGEHLGGVDLTRPWQRREDRPVRVLPEVGGYGAVEVLAGCAESFEHGHQGQYGVADGLDECVVGGAGWGLAQPVQQFGGGAAAGVAVLDVERGMRFSPRRSACAAVG